MRRIRFASSGACALFACALWLTALPACTLINRPDIWQDTTLVKVPPTAAWLGGQELLEGPRTMERSLAAQELLRVAWLAQHSAERTVAYGRAAAWVAERQAAGERSAVELSELSTICAELGAAEQRADAYLFASILYGLFIDTNQLTALGKVPHMLELAHAAAELDPGLYHAWPLRVLGEVYLVVPAGIGPGDLDAAYDYLEQAVELAPDFPGNWVTYGRILYEFEFDEEAEEAFLKALEVDPGEDWATEAEEARAEAREKLTELFDHSFEEE